MYNVFKLDLGLKVKSTISGFKGIITSRSEHINGCNRYWVSPSVDKDGKLPDGYWFDEGELEVIKDKKSKKTKEKNGGFPSSVK